MKRHKKKIFIMAVVFAAAFFYGFYSLVPRALVMTKDPVSAQRKQMAPYQNPMDIGLKYDSISYKGYEGLALKAYFIPSTIDTAKATIIMLHGIRAYKEYFIKAAHKLTEKGYNVVLPDLRAHGESDGRYCTFGIKEKYDIKALIDIIVEEKDVRKIGIWGQSLGGAIAMQAMAIDHRIEFGIVESTFSNFRNVAYDYIDRLAPFLPKWYQDFLIKRGSSIADFDANLANPIDAAKNIDQPILMVHGTADDRISYNYCNENYEALKSQNKELLPVEGATHVNVWQVGGQDYLDSVLGFIEKSEKRQ